MRLIRAGILSLLIGLSVSSFGQDATPPNPPELTPEQKKNVLDSVEDTLKNRAFVPGIDFTKWTEFIAKRQKEIDEAVTISSFARFVNQSLQDFGISHCRLQTPRVAAARGRTTAVGTGIQGRGNEDGIRVGRVADKSPASNAGLGADDVIVSVNGTKATNPEQLNGEKGTKLNLEVKKPDGTIKKIELEVGEFSTVRKETLTWHGDDTAVIRVATFSAGYDRANIEALIKEANAKAKNLILDLRSNGGGAVNNLNHLLSLFLPAGTQYGTFISRRTFEDYVKEHPSETPSAEKIAEWTPRKANARKLDTPPFKGKIAVLINRGSASASEICAAALKELRDAEVVGTRTAGAVLSSVFRPIAEGFSLQHPVSDYVTIKGQRLEANPVLPTQEVTAVRRGDGPDPVLEKAIELLKAPTR